MTPLHRPVFQALLHGQRRVCAGRLPAASCPLLRGAACCAVYARLSCSRLAGLRALVRTSHYTWDASSLSGIVCVLPCCSGTPVAHVIGLAPAHVVVTTRCFYKRFSKTAFRIGSLRIVSGLRFPPFCCLPTLWTAPSGFWTSLSSNVCWVVCGCPLQSPCTCWLWLWPRQGARQDCGASDSATSLRRRTIGVYVTFTLAGL